MLYHALHLGNDTNAFKYMKFCFERQSTWKFRGKRTFLTYTTKKWYITQTRRKFKELLIKRVKTETDLHNMGKEARNRKK